MRSEYIQSEKTCWRGWGRVNARLESGCIGPDLASLFYFIYFFQNRPIRPWKPVPPTYQSNGDVCVQHLGLASIPPSPPPRPPRARGTSLFISFLACKHWLSEPLLSISSLEDSVLYDSAIACLSGKLAPHQSPDPWDPAS